MTPLPSLLSCLALALVAGPRLTSAAELTVGTIDLFGVRTVSEAAIRDALKVKVGDPFQREAFAAAVKALEQIPGVRATSFSPITVDGSGQMRVFVGIQESAAKGFELRPAPTGEEKLPPTLRALYDDMGRALGPAVRSGKAFEDNSQGHSLSADADMRKAQNAAVEHLRTEEAAVRRVLHECANGQERAAAAWLLGYAPDKRTIVADLVAAARDPNSSVRNNATRALSAIAELAAKKPELGLRIESRVFVDMLGSLTWTDRNKSVFVVHGLMKSPTPELIADLRARALPDLIEMARWKSDGHAYPAVVILGRLAGWTDTRARQAYDQGKLDELFAAATASGAAQK